MGTKNWHFIVPAEVSRVVSGGGARGGQRQCAHPLPPPHLLIPLPQEGPFSLTDPTTLCAITEARGRGEAGSTRIAVPAADDPDGVPHQHAVASLFESKMHKMHGALVVWAVIGSGFA